VKAVDPDQQVFGQTRDLEQWIQTQDEYQYGRLVAALFTGFSALAATGLFSVVSYSVAQPTNEFGIRMAMGASPGSVLRLVFTATARDVMGRVVCGIVLSVLISGVLAKWEEGSSQNPLMFGAVTLLMAATAVLAAFFPARRASSVDPMIALRYD